MIADIASGETDWADIFFLVAVIAFALAAVVLVMRRRAVVTDTHSDIPIATVLGYVGLAFTALGFLVL